MVLRRGGSEHEAMIVLNMFANSPVTICSASTFCFFAAAANKVGQVYFPRNGWWGSKPVKCCGEQVNLQSIEHGWSIGSFYTNNGTLLTLATATADEIVSILRNESYVEAIFRRYSPEVLPYY